MEKELAPNAPPVPKRALFALRIILGVGSFVFVGFALKGLVTRWDSSRVSIGWLSLALSFLPLGFGVFLLALSWKWLLEGMTGRAVPTRPALALHFESQLARYTPVKVGVPLVRMAGAPQLGVPTSPIGASVVIELLPYLSVGGAVGFFCLWLGSAHAEGALQALGRWGSVGLVVFGVVTVGLITVPRRFYPRFVLRVLKVEGEGPLIPSRVPLAHAGYWLTWALHGFLTSLAVGSTPQAAFGSAGMYVIGPVAGFLALVTPAGIGVREAIVAVGLAPTLGTAPALAAALVSRISSLIVDVLAWLYGRILVRRDAAGSR